MRPWLRPAGRAGLSTHKNEGRHAARHPLAPLFAARTCRRRAASASARGPGPHSLTADCWAGRSNAFANASDNHPHFGAAVSWTFLVLAVSGEHEQHVRRSATALRRDVSLRGLRAITARNHERQFSYSAAALRHAGETATLAPSARPKSKGARLPV